MHPGRVLGTQKIYSVRGTKHFIMGATVLMNNKHSYMSLLVLAVFYCKEVLSAEIPEKLQLFSVQKLHKSKKKDLIPEEN